MFPVPPITSTRIADLLLTPMCSTVRLPIVRHLYCPIVDAGSDPAIEARVPVSPPGCLRPFPVPSVAAGIPGEEHTARRPKPVRVPVDGRMNKHMQGRLAGHGGEPAARLQVPACPVHG